MRWYVWYLEWFGWFPFYGAIKKSFISQVMHISFVYTAHSLKSEVRDQESMCCFVNTRPLALWLYYFKIKLSCYWKILRVLGCHSEQNFSFCTSYLEHMTCCLSKEYGEKGNNASNELDLIVVEDWPVTDLWLILQTQKSISFWDYGLSSHVPHLFCQRL